MKSKYRDDLDEHIAKQLKNPVFKKYWEETGNRVEIGYRIFQMRKKAGMSQAALAKKIGATKLSIARMETGDQSFTAGVLEKIARALKKDLKIEFV